MVGKLLAEGDALLAEKRIGARVGAETGTVVKMTREAFDGLAIETRAIGAAEASTKTAYFGRDFSLPVMPAALSGLDGICENAMAKVAQGARQAGALMWAGIGGEEELASITATGAATVKVIKPYRDEGLILDKIAQAERHGALAVGMDVNFGFGGKVGDSLIRPELMAPKSLADIERYVGASKLPFVLKGILSVADAKNARQAGAAAIVVSNHGGSIIDYAVPALTVLPAIKRELGDAMLIFLDGGILRGTDVFKALALGADGVLVGRTVMAGLAAGGSEGVARMLTGLSQELARVMSLTGAADIGSIDPSVLWPLARRGGNV